LQAAPFAQVTLEMMKHADPAHPSAKPVPYVGIQYVTIPEFSADLVAAGHRQFVGAQWREAFLGIDVE
jgi:hypothetical protein